MRTTQKQAIETFKATYDKLAVMAFDLNTNNRTHTYSGANMVEAIEDAARRSTNGPVLIMSKEAARECMRWEIRNPRVRITLEIASEYAQLHQLKF